MAKVNLGRLKKRANRFGELPPKDASPHLIAAETAAPAAEAPAAEAPALQLVAPTPPPTTTAKAKPAKQAAKGVVPKGQAPLPQPRPAALDLQPRAAMPRPERIDGRMLRRTGRTVPLSLHVTQAFDESLRRAAERDGLLFAQVLERALALYEAEYGNGAP